MITAQCSMSVISPAAQHCGRLPLSLAMTLRLLTVPRLFQLQHHKIRSMSSSAANAQPELLERVRRFFEFEKPAENVFSTSNTNTYGQQSRNAAYGGLIMAQSLAAAEMTVSSEFKPHSMHANLIIGVDTSKPVSYGVRLLRDGRSFKTRSVEAVQEGKVAFTLQASFHTKEADSCAHQIPLPSHVPPPEKCMSLKEIGQELQDRVNSGKLVANQQTTALIEQTERYAKRIFENRCTDIDALLGLVPNSEKLYYWLKPKVSVAGEDERLHRWLAVFVSDAGPFTAVIHDHAKNNFAVSMLFSLNHTMHFHHSDLNVDEWMLYEVQSPIAAAGRGFSVGRLWSASGRLLVSVSQEVLVRTNGEVSRLARK